jgi:Arc/MetJ-type ribon-helix-helix transcriptional regulator
MTEVVLKVPNHIQTALENLVNAGWYVDVNEIFLLAVRTYLKSHTEELMTTFITEDIEWGLRGNI